MRAYRSPFRGSWYPADAVELRELIARLAEQSAARTGDGLPTGALAYVVPHAGLVYSGTVAEACYRLLKQRKPARVWVLGFPHSTDFDGLAAPDIESYSTPLGEVEVDLPATGALRRHPLFAAERCFGVCDHSVEIQLPLLKEAVPDAKLVPVYTGRLDDDQRGEAARLLLDMIEPDDVLLASSDFTHYGKGFGYQPFPAGGLVAEQLAELDDELMEAAGSLDGEIFEDTLHRRNSTLCGHRPIRLLQEMLRGRQGSDEVFQETLDYQTSGDITGDYGHSVSYACLGYYPAPALRIGEDDQRALLDSARATLSRLAATGERKVVAAAGGSAALERRAGCFVSLHDGPKLRGCMGCLRSTEPLREAIGGYALASATGDPRFRSMHAGDSMPDIEISILTPRKRAASRLSFQAGEHGASLECGERRGLLLPQVAKQGCETREKFLNALAVKAGLPRDVYARPDARFHVFRAQVFGLTAAGDWRLS